MHQSFRILQTVFPFAKMYHTLLVLLKVFLASDLLPIVGALSTNRAVKEVSGQGARTNTTDEHRQLDHNWSMPLNSARHRRQPRQPHDGPLIVWVRFGGVGSATLKKALLERSKRRGWQPNGFKDLCRVRDFDESVDQNPPCAHGPDGSVVQAEFKYCDAVKRPCAYITMLMDPRIKMVRQYTLNCLRCGKSHKGCSLAENQGRSNQTWFNDDLEPLPPPSCPHMSFLDYARIKGNEYVAEFSGKSQFCKRTGMLKDTPEYRECVAAIADIDCDSALSQLNATNIFVATAGETWEEDVWRNTRLPGVQGLELMLNDKLHFPRQDFYRFLKTRRRRQGYALTPEEVTGLEEILKFDIKFYNAARQRQEELAFQRDN